MPSGWIRRLKTVLLTIFGFLETKFWLTAKNVSTVMWEPQSICTGNQIWFFVENFLWIARKFFSTSDKSFFYVCENRILRDQWIKLMKNIVVNHFCFERETSDFLWKNFDRYVKTARYLCRGTKWDFFLLFSWASSDAFLNFCHKIFCRVVRTAFYVSSGSICWKTV